MACPNKERIDQHAFVAGYIKDRLYVAQSKVFDQATSVGRLT